MEYIVLGLGLLAIAAVFGPRLAWAARYPFLATNWLQWFLMSPPLYFLRNHRAAWPRVGFLALSPLGIAYWLSAYVVLAPLRLLNALYFDLILFLAVVLRDGLADLVVPSYNTHSKLRYLLRWIGLLPWRIARTVGKYLLSVLQGIAMTAFDVVWPTLTLFHGTTLEDAALDIARKGVWWIGTGNYAGTGIYFSINQAVAEHYSEKVIRQEIANKIMIRPGGTPAVIVARVTHEPCRPIATLPQSLRRMVGIDGDTISRGLAFPWAALQHWRDDRGWWEFCLVQSRANTRLNTWRVRPVCVVKTKEPSPLRVEGGLAVWPANARGWMVLGLTLALFLGVLLPISATNGPLVDPFGRLGPVLTAISATRPPAKKTPIPSRQPTKAPTPNLDYCPFEAGDRVKLDTQANVWAEPEVKDDSGKLMPVQTLAKGTNVYLVSGPRRGYINWASDVKGYWWEISLSRDSSAIGWIWECALQGCDWAD